MGLPLFWINQASARAVYRPLSAAVLALLCVCTISQAQLPAPEDAGTVESASLLTISKAVDEVRLNFTVTDKSGRFIKALKNEDFNLLDDVRPAERIIKFQANSESPLRVVLLFDISSSIRSRFGFEQKAANHFLKHVLRPKIDKAAVISFGTEVREVQPMTGDVDKLTAAVAHLQPGGDTALHDAVIRASRDLSKGAPFDSRKIMIILSDGADTSSHASAKECMVAAVSSDATILVVDASVPSDHNSPGQIFLRRVSENSGGFVLPAREDSDLKGAFRKIDAVLRNQYALTYKPALFERNGAYRTIQLAARKQGLIVHARNGYYASAN